MRFFSRKVFIIHPISTGRPVGQAEVYQAEEAIGLVKALGWTAQEGVFKDLKFDQNFEQSEFSINSIPEEGLKVGQSILYMDQRLVYEGDDTFSYDYEDSIDQQYRNSAAAKVMY